VPVHYRSSYAPDLLAGQVQLAFSPIPTTIEQVRAGKLRALAVTGEARSQALPEVPTVGEFVPGYKAAVWNGLVAPKNTPADIIDKLHKEIDAGLSDPKMIARFAQVGSVPQSMTIVEFGKFIVEDTEKWSKAIRAANIKPEGGRYAGRSYSINPVWRMAAMAATGSNATTRQVCSNVRVRGQERTGYAHIEFFAS